MSLTKKEEDEFNSQGFTITGVLFNFDELKVISEEIERLIAQKVPGLVYESDARTVRMFNGGHLHSDLLRRLCRDRRLIVPAMRLLGDDVYIHRFKFNQKNAFIGDVWDWHQDFCFWHAEDGMPEPRALTVAILIDSVNEFNAPLTFIPRSKDTFALQIPETTIDPTGAGWTADVSPTLKYRLGREAIATAAVNGGLHAPKGACGCVLIFDCDVLHCSTVNMSPFHRRMLFVTYNAISNAPPSTLVGRRPEFLAGTCFDPMPPLPLSENFLSPRA